MLITYTLVFFLSFNITICIYVNYRFLSIDEQPVAAASIAQVHRAVLKSGHEVAIKVCLVVLVIS